LWFHNGLYDALAGIGFIIGKSFYLLLVIPKLGANQLRKPCYLGYKYPTNLFFMCRISTGHKREIINNILKISMLDKKR